ncbi:uncharacterized protein BDZ99DRAFT_524135 [Mytilinidion resinicola]|uniref:MFS general substrate transporter n=1 Tax=Mytilinidion resinicola TaxID=574789 RepID=A0A6A6YAP3_9PEZI|nr:uncharacterized protein BDZ99DRAFT_524135 [Mytilinidion resinicola]KAF2805891.1 hypothetical protein BDZ99DRAFT_524135 [Mytilinidion resinicola]
MTQEEKRSSLELAAEKADNVYVEDVGSDRQQVEPAEMEAKMNWQTIIAYLALASQFNAYILTLLIPSTILPYINADLGPDPNYPWITIS